MAVEIPELTGFFKQQNLVQRFNKNQIICIQDERFDAVYKIDSGMVKSYDLDAGGSERTIAIFGPNNIFPLAWMLNDPPVTHWYYYEAFTNVTCSMVNKDNLHGYIREHPEALLAAVDALTKAYTNLAARIRNLERSHVHERLQFVLYTLAVHLGKIDGDIADIDTIITQEDISRLAGVTRESISLEFSQSDRRLLWRSGHHTYINVGELNVSELPTFLT